MYDSVVLLATENEVANKAEWRAVLRSFRWCLLGLLGRALGGSPAS